MSKKMRSEDECAAGSYRRAQAPPHHTAADPDMEGGLSSRPTEEQRPRVCIVTPSFNQGRFIQETIESVLMQTPPVDEFFVADGGSQDETVSILMRYGSMLRWISEPDRGQADAVNKAIAATTGDIIGWINSDDLYVPGTVAAVLEAFAGHPDVDLVYGDFEVIDEFSIVRGIGKAKPVSAWKLLTGRTFIPQPGTFFRRRLWEKLGGLDTTFDYAMDLDFFIRAAMHAKIMRLDRVLARFRIWRGSKTVKDEPAFRPECLRAALKNGGPLSWAFRRVSYFGSDIRHAAGSYKRRVLASLHGRKN